MPDPKNPEPIDPGVAKPGNKGRKPFPNPGESDPGDLVPDQPERPKPQL